MRFLFCFLLLSLSVGTARADPGLLYAGASIAHDDVSNFGAQFNPQLPSDLPDISATSWKALVGVRPLHWFAVEADYMATAGSSGSSLNSLGNRSEARALAGYGVFLTGSDAFEVFGKLGIEGYTLTARYASSGSDTATGAGAALGGGFQLHFGRAGLRLEYEWLPGVGRSNGLQVVSLGVLLDLL